MPHDTIWQRDRGDESNIASALVLILVLALDGMDESLPAGKARGRQIPFSSLQRKIYQTAYGIYLADLPQWKQHPEKHSLVSLQ